MASQRGETFSPRWRHNRVVHKNGGGSPAELGPSSTTGHTFSVGERIDGKNELYYPQVENVRLIVLREKVFRYVKNGAMAQRRKLVEDLWLCLGVRDEQNGAYMLLTDGRRDRLGLPFEASIDEMSTSIPELPIMRLGELATGEPVVGFRGRAHGGT